MRGEQVKLRRRLESLQRAAAAGNAGAAGEARLLESWLDDEEAIRRKRQDDRCKVLVGALVGQWLSTGRPVLLHDQLGLLDALDNARPAAPAVSAAQAAAARLAAASSVPVDG